ncbi:MAG: tetratricopeptide repeat protein [Spirochaetaceae bacterium]|nr:tetratricopeptide repeat protein [Spirochaetaceae bacterium]
MSLAAAAFALLLSCAGQRAVTSAEEYYAIGMAYFDMGKYADAEKWLKRAREADKTRTASDYNLGRIAFEAGRYDDALKRFQEVLAKDPDNVMALKAAAYTQVKRKDLGAAQSLYGRVLELTPESADDGYNYALLLYIMEQYERSEEVLSRYRFALLENSDLILLMARNQRARRKPEAADRYAQWLEMKSDPLVRYEYALTLEEHGFFARALEEYRSSLKDLPKDSKNPNKADLRYRIARLSLEADPQNGEGMAELNAAVAEGFEDIPALEALAAAVPEGRKEEIMLIIEGLAAKKAPEPGGADGGGS